MPNAERKMKTLKLSASEVEMCWLHNSDAKKMCALWETAEYIHWKGKNRKSHAYYYDSCKICFHIYYYPLNRLKFFLKNSKNQIFFRTCLLLFTFNCKNVLISTSFRFACRADVSLMLIPFLNLYIFYTNQKFLERKKFLKIYLWLTFPFIQ